MKHIVFLGLGSNLGDKELNINAALQQIHSRIGTLVQRSSFYYSKPQGFESPNDFVNIVAKIETELSPFELLAVTQEIEKEMGRTEKSTFDETAKVIIHHDRIIDIDILLYLDDNRKESIVIDMPKLKIPHPRMKERDFVMLPLSEII